MTPSTGFHAPGVLTRPQMEAIALSVGEGRAHILTWYGHELLIVHYEGTWPELRAYEERVAAAVCDALEARQEPPKAP